jgi:uncharacterized protein (DUF488 family)
LPAGRAFTIGHSTHPPDAFPALLGAHGVRRIADVRRFHGSRRHPPLDREALAPAKPTAVMRAEALRSPCHRRLVADALVARGWAVGRFRPHADARAGRGGRPRAGAGPDRASPLTAGAGRP